MKLRTLSVFDFVKLRPVKNAIFIVIDTFRATSSIVTLKNSGASNICVTQNGSDAKKLKSSILQDTLLIGEYKGLMIEGFDYGNTPSVFYNMDFSRKDIIFTSSSGAKVINALKGYDDVFIGSLLNMQFVSEAVVNLSKARNSPIYIIPSGSILDESAYVIEDWITGVLIANYITNNFNYNDESRGEFYLKTKELLSDNTDLDQLLRNSPNGKSLVKMGFDKDVDIAIKLNQIKNAPKVKEYRTVEDISFCVIF